MTMQELKEILAEQFSCDEVELEPETTLTDLGADAEDLIELAWQLGEVAGVEISESDLDADNTVEQLWRFVREMEEAAE